MIPWHRLLGAAFNDYFSDQPFTVKMEYDISIYKQLLDIVVIRKQGGQFHGKPPDGFEELGDYNLITYKSLNESLTGWAMGELNGYYVGYRKIQMTNIKKNIPESAFRWFVLCTSYPEKCTRCAASC